MKSWTIVLLGALWLSSPVVAQNQLLSTLSDLERGFWDAHARNDRGYFEQNLSDDVVDVSSEGVAVGKKAIIDRTFGCTSGKHELENWALHRVRDDVAIVTLEAEYTTTCDGKRTEHEVVVSSTYARMNGRWLNVAYQESTKEED